MRTGLFRAAVLLFASFTGQVSGANEPSPLMVIDTPAILRTAIEAAYRENSELEQGDLVAEQQGIWMTCHPEPQWLPIDPLSLHCPAQASQQSQCKARVSFVIRSSIKRDVIARQDGYCQVHEERESIDVTVFPDGSTSVSQSSGSGSSSHHDCEKVDGVIEVEGLIRQYETALFRELES